MPTKKSLKTLNVSEENLKAINHLTVDWNMTQNEVITELRKKANL